MKNLTRLISVILVITMLFVLSSCFNVKEVVKDAIKEELNGSKDTENDENDENDEFSIGETAGNTYTNKYFGITVTLDSTWNFKTQEELDADRKQVEGVLGDDFNEKYNTGASFFDMNADNENGDAVNVVVTVLSDEEAKCDNAALIEAFNAAEADTKAAYENMGLTNVVCDIGEREFLGDQVVYQKVTANVNEELCFVDQVIFIKGNYSCTITTSSYMEDITDTLINKFQSIGVLA